MNGKITSLFAKRSFKVLQLQITTATFLASLLISMWPASASALTNPISTENQKTGTSNWVMTQTANDLDKQIKGYASATSVNLGGSINFMVSVNRPQNFTIEFYRMGWYQGLGGRLISKTGQIAGQTRTYTAPDPTTGLIEYNWPSSYTLKVPTSWVSGIYMAKLINADGYQNYVPFVVRNDSRASQILYQQSVTTDQAYNNFPDVSPTNPNYNPNDPSQISKSLYEGSSKGNNTIAGTQRAVKVSFNRPYADDGSGKFFIWENNQVRWLERMGYDVTYSTNLDTHERPTLTNHKAFISSGHDEYWTGQMRTNVESARDRKVNLAFFGANAGYWQVRLEPSAGGVANRTMTCYKDKWIDPVATPSAKTITFRDLGRPEQTLIGVQYTTYGDSLSGNSAWSPIAAALGNSVFSGTGMTSTSQINGLVGYEIDAQFANYPMPANLSYTLLSSSSYFDANGQTQQSNSVLYQAPSGAWVFGSGTLSWSWGLDDAGYGGELGVVDSRVQKISQNVLAKFGTTPATPFAAVALAPALSQSKTSAQTTYQPPAPQLAPIHPDGED